MKSHLVTLILTLGIACTQDEHSNATSDLDICRGESTVTPVELNSSKDLGFSARDGLPAEGAQHGSVEWREPAADVVALKSPAAGTRSAVSAEVKVTGATALVVRGKDSACFDHIEVPVDWAIAAEDGSLKVHSSGTLIVSQKGSAELTAELPISKLEGSLEIQPQSSLVEVNLRVALHWAASGAGGNILVTGQKKDNGSLVLLQSAIGTITLD